MARFEVSPAAAHELLPACRLLFTEGRAEHSRDRILSDAHTSGLFVARDAGRLRAAALVQALPGALGVAWAPRGDSAEAIDAATAAACEWLQSRGVKVCQAFAEASEVAAMSALERHGFRHTTQLVFMRRGVDSECDRGQCELRGRYFIPALRARFVAAILATHTGTLDCPELSAGRTATELIAGFALPEHPSSGFWLAEANEGDVGVFVVEVSADRKSLDLSYLGVVPAARGHGYGDQLVRRILHDASFFVEAVTLSVDARNLPARKLYSRHGFVEYDRREVWLATWPA